MELNDISVVARTVFSGFDDFEATAGQTVKVKTSPKGQDILNELVPEGESWRVIVNVQITKSVEE